jgi:tripartite-type tricarboxylate transporter receptor subunit TctC
MKLPRRNFLHLASGAAALPVVSLIARAQGYPTRPVRLLVGFAPAGTTDIHARLIAQWLSERLGQQFIVENRVGAGGNLATEAVVRAAPDGYTLLEASAADAWNATLYSNLKFNFIRDIAPVASISKGMNVLLVHPTLPVKSIPDLIAYTKTNPGKVIVASAGVGSSPHISWELFRAMTGTEMLHVPYRGGGPALTDMLAGQAQVYFGALGSSIEYVKSGNLRALAVTGATRSDALPDIPSVGEFVPGYEASGWQGIGAPRNTPTEIVDKLNKEINAVLADPKMKARLADLGSTAFVNSPADFGKFIAEFTERWGKIIRSANIKADLAN